MKPLSKLQIIAIAIVINFILILCAFFMLYDSSDNVSDTVNQEQHPLPQSDTLERMPPEPEPITTSQTFKSGALSDSDDNISPNLLLVPVVDLISAHTKVSTSPSGEVTTKVFWTIEDELIKSRLSSYFELQETISIERVNKDIVNQTLIIKPTKTKAFSDLLNTQVTLHVTSGSKSITIPITNTLPDGSFSITLIHNNPNNTKTGAVIISDASGDNKIDVKIEFLDKRLKRSFATKIPI